MLQEAVVIAYALFIIEALYSFHLYLRRRSREAEQRLYTSLAALAIALPLMLVDIADIASRLFHTQYTLFSPDLTLTYALKAKEASNATAAAMARMSAYLAAGESVAMAVSWAAALFTGGLSLLIGYAVQAGIATLRGLANAALMISQALYAVAALYEIIARLALPMRALVPLGLALSVARRARPLGGLLLALGLGFGYVLPFALNSVAYQVRGVSLEAPETGVPSVMCIRAVTAARTVNGTTLAAGFPAVIEYVDLTRPGRVVVRPPGCYVELTGEYRVTRVFFGPEPVRAEVGFTVRPLPPGLNLTYLTYDDLVVGRVPFPDLARAAEQAGNNVTVFVPWGPMPLRLDAERFTALWDDGYFSWVATNIFNFTELGARRASGETAKWYNFTYFPTRYDRLEAVLKAGDSWSFLRNVTITKDGRNYTVTVNCTAWEGYAYGTLEEVKVVDRGLVEVNGSLLEPEVVVEWRPRYRWDPDAWRRFANETFNRWFNQSARIFNHTFVVRGPLYVELSTEGGSVRDLAVSVRTSYYRGPVRAFLNPYFHWGTPPEIPLVRVRAVYCGRLVRPARAALTLSDGYYAGQPVRAEYLLLLSYDPLLEPFARDVPLTITLREEARNFIFHIYPFIFMVGVAFTLSVLAMDAISGFLGGPSITMRFLPERFQQAYWDVFTRELPRLMKALAGKHLPVPHSALIPAKYRPVLEQLRREAELVRKQYPLQRLRAWAAQTRVGQALQRARQLVQARAARLRGAVDEALRSAAQRLEARGHRVAPRLLELTRRLLTEAGPRAVYWAFMLARYTWEHRSEHTINALLQGAAHALRAHARKKYGPDAHLHPVGFRLLRLADRLELVELLLNNRALAERLVWRASLALYERAREVRAAEAAEGYAVTVALQARELATVLLRQRREAGLALLDAAERLEGAARGLQAKREAFKAARNEHRLAAETLRFWERVLAEALRTGERVEERAARVEEWARAELEARRALEAARAELERARAELLELAREVEGLIRREAPEVYGYVERALREAFELASRVEEMGVDAYGRAVERVVHALSLLAGSDAPSWAREAAKQAMERWEQLLKDWRQVYRTEKQFEVLQQLAAGGEALQPPKPEVPQPSAAPAGLEELAARSEVERLASELRGALAGHDYGRLPELIDRYLAALGRLEREAQGTELAEWARAEREAWLAARDELLTPPELLHLRGEAERLAGELRKALDAKDYTAVAERLPEYAEVLARLSEAPAPQLAEWARSELERLSRVRDELLQGYYEVAEALGGEPLAALKADRFAFELALSLAHVSPEAAERLLDRIEDGLLREWARGYLEAARAYEAAREEEGAWARERIFGSFGSLGSAEARAGFIAYAVERSLPFAELEVHRFGASARIVEEAFYEEARRLAVSPEPEDWRSLLDEFVKTYDPEILGKALAHAALAGEVDELRQDGRVRGFVEKCHGDVSRFEWWVEQRPRVEGEVAARLQAIYQELSEIEERAMALRSEWAPEPGESAALRMRAELEVARAREVVAELLERVEELRSEGEALRRRAEDFLLPTHPFDELRDRINRLIDLLTRLGDELW
jgi:hypothetical protein